MKASTFDSEGNHGLAAFDEGEDAVEDAADGRDEVPDVVGEVSVVH